jgi:hypothetical protein
VDACDCRVAGGTQLGAGADAITGMKSGPTLLGMEACNNHGGRRQRRVDGGGGRRGEGSSDVLRHGRPSWGMEAATCGAEAAAFAANGAGAARDGRLRPSHGRRRWRTPSRTAIAGKGGGGALRRGQSSRGEEAAALYVDAGRRRGRR